MNIHQPSEEIRARHSAWKFRGKRWTVGGKTWIRAQHKTVGWKWFYCFEEDRFGDDAGYQSSAVLTI